MKLKHFRTLVPFSPSSPSSCYSLSIFISHFSTSQTQPYHSHSSSWRHEEASRQVKVSVWWDFENCSPPVGFNVFKIANLITSAVRANGIKGPVQITAFGDVFQLSRTNQEALSSTGINLAHVPKGGKNSADRSLLVDLLYWVSQNPPPAHLFLISGDKDFASVLHRLRMNNYNVLLATSESAPGVLRSAASIMWNWNVLLKGESLNGKHYNQPPDGPYGSWYGHHKAPLEDPFLVDQPVCTQTEELSGSCSDSNVRPVPKAVMKHIREILNSCPKGISVTELRTELNKSNVGLDKDLYGYKKFSRFLLSMPHILRLHSEHDGNFFVHGVTPKSGELSKTSPCLYAGPVCRTGDELTVSSRSSDRTVDDALNEKPRLHHSPEVNARVSPRKIQETPPEKGKLVQVNAEKLQTPPEKGKLVQVNAEKLQEEVQQPLSVDQKIAKASNHSPEVNARVSSRKIQETPPEKGKLVQVNAEKLQEEVQQPLSVDQKIAKAPNDPVPESLQDCMPEQDSGSEGSFIRKLWKKWFRGSIDNPAEKDNKLPGKHGDSVDSSEKRNNNTLKECTGVGSERDGMKKESCEVPHPVTSSSSGNDSTVDTKASENHSGKRNNSTLKKCTGVSSEREGVKDPVTISSSSNGATVDTEATNEASENHYGKRWGLHNWIAGWGKFWRGSEDSEASSDPSHENLNQTNMNPFRHEVFDQGSFWEDMESLIDSPRGSLFVRQSKTREDMAENLLKEGPLVLRSLSNTDLVHLVDMLISDKKWIKECPSQASPFKITKAVGKSPGLGNSCAANGLRSIFVRTSSQANLQTEQEREKKLQSIAYSGVSSTIPNKKSSDRSRFQVLSDCQNLVKEVLKEHPEGYCIGDFPTLFLERYGYPLHIQSLGYKKLVYLLAKTPGIKIESNYIIPASMVPCNFGPETTVPNIRRNTGEALLKLLDLDVATTKVDSDTTWDELGPVSKANATRNEMQSVSGSKRTEGTKTIYPYYPPLSDDESSDSESGISTAEQAGLQRKPEIGEEESHLLHILNKWHNGKEGKDKTDNSEDSKALIGCSEYDVKPSGAAEEGTMKTEDCLEEYGKKERVLKKYTFVADSEEERKLVNGIFSNLRKTNGSRMEA